MTKTLLFDFFGTLTIFTSIQFGKRKPSPDFFHYAITSLKANPQKTVFIGDSYTSDYLGAKGAGLTPILVDKNYAYPDVSERAETVFEITRFIN